MGLWVGNIWEMLADCCANNLRNITVTFNKEVEGKSITSSNVKVYDGTTLLSGVTLNLLDDNKTLLITNNGSYTQLKEYKVVVENVETKGDATKKIEKTEKVVTVVDTTLPTVESVTATSPKTVEIVFSEPIQTGSGAGQFPTTSSVLTDIVQIDGINAYAVPSVTAIDTQNKVVLTLNTPLTAGDHKVKVANLKDYANLPIASKEFAVNIPIDTAAPEVTGVEVLNKNNIKVTFNEPIDNATITFANIKVDNAAVTGATAKQGGKVYEFTVGGTGLNLAAVVESTFEYKGIKDNYGNEVKDAKTFKFKAVDDTTAPTVSNVKVNSDNTIEVTFSEDVTGFTGITTVELYDKDNKKLTNTVAVAKKVIDSVASDKVYVLTISSGSSLSGAHSIKILKDNVTDLSIRTNKFTEATYSVTLNDKVAPEITKVEFVNDVASTVDFNSDADYKDSKATIYFGEAMDAATLTNKSNYLINGTPLADVTGTVTLTSGTDNKSVTITINRGSADNQLTFATNTDLRVIAVKDPAGNTLASSQVNANLGTAGLISAYVSDPGFTTAVSKVEAISKNQLKVYAQSGYLFSGIDANKIKFTENQSGTALIPGLQVTSVSIAADGKTAVLTLNNNMSADGKYDGSDVDTDPLVVSLYADASAITLTNGAKTQALANTAGLNAIDKTAPSISTVTKDSVNADTVVLTFDETVHTSSVVGLASDLVVKLGDGTVLNPAAGDYVVADAAADAKLEVKIIKSGVSNSNVTVELKDGRYIADASGNTANVFAVKDVMDGTAKAQMTEKTVPTATAHGDNDNLPSAPDTIAAAGTFTVTFSEKLSATGKTNVETAFETVDTDFGYTWSADGLTLTVTNSGAAAATFSADVTADLVDEAGNVNAAQAIHLF